MITLVKQIIFQSIYFNISQSTDFVDRGRHKLNSSAKKGIGKNLVNLPILENTPQSIDYV